MGEILSVDKVLISTVVIFNKSGMILAILQLQSKINMFRSRLSLNLIVLSVRYGTTRSVQLLYNMVPSVSYGIN